MPSEEEIRRPTYKEVETAIKEFALQYWVNRRTGWDAMKYALTAAEMVRDKNES